jgi:hypothetical protein
MNIGTAHLGVILPAGSSGHQAIAKINQTAQLNEREQYGLFQTDSVIAAGFFFQKAPGTNLRVAAHGRFIQKNGIGKVSSPEFNIRTQLTVH